MVILYEITKDGETEQIASDKFTDEVSDMESLPIDVNHLSAGKDTTSSIRIHADDPSTISANIQSYVPR